MLLKETMGVSLCLICVSSLFFLFAFFPDPEVPKQAFPSLLLTSFLVADLLLSVVCTRQQSTLADVTARFTMINVVEQRTKRKCVRVSYKAERERERERLGLCTRKNKLLQWRLVLNRRWCPKQSYRMSNRMRPSWQRTSIYAFGEGNAQSQT